MSVSGNDGWLAQDAERRDKQADVSLSHPQDKSQSAEKHGRCVGFPILLDPGSSRRHNTGLTVEWSWVGSEQYKYSLR
ncbi:hypothetical protein LIA77_08762 [Sarocladium implicatum]|nr:hypothetical protein LIA77_08762 [Sarocladium implicatum]